MERSRIAPGGEPFPGTHRFGWIATALTALSGLFLTALLSQLGCGTTDGSFEVDWPGADPSRYCELSRFPGIPDTVGSLALVLSISLAPAALAVLGMLSWRSTGRVAFAQVGIAMAGVALFALLVVLVVIATVEFHGVV